MVAIKLYTKPGCWLCDAAEAMLNGLVGRYPIEIDRLDISADDDLYELYRFDIPVIEFPDGETQHGQIKKKALLKKLDDITK
jgi:hypothetical protein